MTASTSIFDLSKLRRDWRGYPYFDPDTSAQQLTPFGGQMALPLVSINLQAFRSNLHTMISICHRHNAELCPHIKTPMSPDIAREYLEAGARGVSVCDIRQLEVILNAGVQHVMLASQIGGRHAIQRLAAVADRHPDAEIHLFVDSPEFVSLLNEARRQRPVLSNVSLMVEIGCGRGGVETEDEAVALIHAISNSQFRLSGIATYEGTANDSDPIKREHSFNGLFARVGTAIECAQAAVGENSPLILTAGGSGFFDEVITRTAPIISSNANVTLVLRCGAAYFGDHGLIQQRLYEVADRGYLGSEASHMLRQMQPALRLWAEVLSVRARGHAICGFGLRDAAHDQGLPVPLRCWRDGQAILKAAETISVVKLNDQHAFLDTTEFNLQIGDVLEFGVRHPCTSLDKHSVIYGTDAQHRVETAIPTFFG